MIIPDRGREQPGWARWQYGLAGAVLGALTGFLVVSTLVLWVF